MPHPRITVQSGLGALFTHLSTIRVDGAAAPPPSRPAAHTSTCVFFPSEVAPGWLPATTTPSPLALVPSHTGSSFRHRRGGKGVRRRGSLSLSRPHHLSLHLPRCWGVRSTQLLRGRWRRMPGINFGTTSLRLSRLPNRFKFCLASPPTP